MSTAGCFAAVDLGATSGRVMIGHVGPEELRLEEVHRFDNEPVRTVDGLHWNILELYRNVLVGLRLALQREPGLTSVGIDSWAVDYGLLRGDRLLTSPYHYRDDRTAAGVAAVAELVTAEDLYAASGLQFLPFNTLYQLAVDAAGGVIDAATTMLLVPDLIAFWLTGRQAAERTNASTTGLLDVSTGSWNYSLVDLLGLPRSLLPPLIGPGERVGRVLAGVADELGSNRPLDVVAIGSHDTASAVVGVPMLDRAAAFISSGTWSLVGIELDHPVLTDAGRKANFTNEGGVDGRVRYLRNVMGLWLLTESVKSWQRAGQAVELAALLEQAADVRTPVPIFDVNHPSLLPPGDLPARIADVCREQGEPAPTAPAEVVRSILESLAVAYADAVRSAEQLSGQPVRVVHVVGGGSQNSLLGQLTADRTGLPVLAGPVEATALGNVLVQARAAGRLSGSLEDLRGLVARTHPATRYEPHGA